MPFSGFPSFFSGFYETDRGMSLPERRLWAFCRRTRVYNFEKIYPYYSTSNRQNQPLFATFQLQIANSSFCTNNPCAIRNILFNTANLIFLDLFHPVLSRKCPGISFLYPPAGKRRLYSPRRRKRHFVSFLLLYIRCVCNCGGFILHFAGAPALSFTFFPI